MIEAAPSPGGVTVRVCATNGPCCEVRCECVSVRGGRLDNHGRLSTLCLNEFRRAVSGEGAFI